MTPDKVYCCDCKYLTDTMYLGCTCQYPIGKGTWYSPEGIKWDYQNPRRANENNDCPHYKRKSWKFWR